MEAGVEFCYFVRGGLATFDLFIGSVITWKQSKFKVGRILDGCTKERTVLNGVYSGDFATQILHDKSGHRISDIAREELRSCSNTTNSMGAVLTRMRP